MKRITHPFWVYGKKCCALKPRGRLGMSCREGRSRRSAEKFVQGLEGIDKNLYFYFLKCTDRQTDICSVSLDLIAQKENWSREEMDNAIARLIEKKNIFQFEFACRKSSHRCFVCAPYFLEAFALLKDEHNRFGESPYGNLSSILENLGKWRGLKPKKKPVLSGKKSPSIL